MRFRAPVIILAVAATMACSSQRKLSQVETRKLASVATAEVHLSPLREKVSRLERFAKACPVQLADTLPSLATEKVRVPACPESLGVAFLEAKDVLRMDERSQVEELLGSGCRALPRDFHSGPLVSLLEGLPPASLRRGGEEEATPENEMALRMKMTEGLRQVRSVHEPLEQWVRLHGEYVMAEEELDFFDRLVAVQQCRMGDQLVDESYRALHNLEDLARIHPAAEAQRQKLERLLSGVHTLIDRKIGEYFRK